MIRNIRIAGEGGVYSEAGTRLFSSEVVVMQFTGLKDKNGKEIFEGDVFKYIPPSGKTKHTKKPFNIILVEWESKRARFIAKVIGQDGQFPRLSDIVAHEHHHLAGNIYENPDLLP